jgi:hypothetical protein
MKKTPMKVLMWFSSVGKAVVQGESANQYVVDYVHQICMCDDHKHRHRCCKHITYVLVQLTGDSPPWEVADSTQAVCDVCEKSKPLDQFKSPGHLPGGRAMSGFDIDSTVCISCAKDGEDSIPF